MEDGLADETGRVSQMITGFYYQLEDESFRLTGLLPNDNDGKSQRMPPSRNPTGSLLVRNTNANALIPVVGVKVKTRRLVKLGHGYTNGNGVYTINKSYRYDVNYSVSFENQSGFKVWNTLIDVNPANFNGPKQNRNGWSYNFETNSFGWRFATVTNAVRRYFVHASIFGIGLPHSNLRIAALDRTGSSSAPMLRRVWGLYGFTTNSGFANFLLKANGISLKINLIATVTKFVQPDLIIAAAVSNGTAEIYETTFHELAHASHQTKVGSSYWVKYINYIITYGSYGNGTGQNVGICALGEAWGFHIGWFLARVELGNNAVVSLQEQEDFVPWNQGRGDGTDIEGNNRAGWIPRGLLFDLMDVGIDDVRNNGLFFDNASGYNNRQFFNALDQDVQSPQEFRDRLLLENGNTDRDDVLNLFEAYFW